MGGPLDGQDIDSTAATIILNTEGSGMVYHRTLPSDWERPDPNWWDKGLPEPVVPEPVYEWHRYDWENPEVRAIKGAYQRATAKVFG